MRHSEENENTSVNQC